jgi:anti-sigma factor RsiW
MNRTLDHAEARELLNDYVDEALPEAQKVAVERHLEGCRTCRHEVDRLRELIRQAASLAQEIEPQRDLWPGVAAAVRGEAARNGRGPLHRLIEQFIRTFGSRRAIWPTALATATAVVVVLLVISDQQDAGDTAGRPQPVTRAEDTAVQELPDPAAVALIQALEAECRQGDHELMMLASAGEEGQGTGILDVISENLRIVNQAVAEARQAWTADPNCPGLVRLLTAAYRAKAILQGRAIDVSTRT